MFGRHNASFLIYTETLSLYIKGVDKLSDAFRISYALFVFKYSHTRHLHKND